MARAKTNTTVPAIASVAKGEGTHAPVDAIAAGATAEGADPSAPLSPDARPDAGAEAEGHTPPAPNPDIAAAESEVVSDPSIEATAVPEAHVVNGTETAATLAQRTGSGLVVEVVAKQPSRWRIGRLFTPEPVRIAIEDLTAGQQVALIGDPMLVCTVVDPD